MKKIIVGIVEDNKSDLLNLKKYSVESEQVSITNLLSLLFLFIIVGISILFNFIILVLYSIGKFFIYLFFKTLL